MAFVSRGQRGTRFDGGFHSSHADVLVVCETGFCGRFDWVREGVTAFLPPEESNPAGVRGRKNNRLRKQALPVTCAASSRFNECPQRVFGKRSCGRAG
jgi:hypothetical protein